MTDYKIVTDFGREDLLNLEVTSTDILKVGRTLAELQYAFEGNRDKQVPRIRLYRDGTERSLLDFNEDFVRALESSPNFGSALRD